MDLITSLFGGTLNQEEESSAKDSLQESLWYLNSIPCEYEVSGYRFWRSGLNGMYFCQWDAEKRQVSWVKKGERGERLLGFMDAEDVSIAWDGEAKKWCLRTQSSILDHKNTSKPFVPSVPLLKVGIPEWKQAGSPLGSYGSSGGKVSKVDMTTFLNTERL